VSIRTRARGALAGKAAIVSGGDSGIGRAVAIAFAREGADVVISYLDEEEDVRETARWVEKAGRKAVFVGVHGLPAGSPRFCPLPCRINLQLRATPGAPTMLMRRYVKLFMDRSKVKLEVSHGDKWLECPFIGAFTVPSGLRTVSCLMSA
jgi:hypothetical protein